MTRSPTIPYVFKRFPRRLWPVTIFVMDDQNRWPAHSRQFSARASTKTENSGPHNVLGLANYVPLILGNREFGIITLETLIPCTKLRAAHIKPWNLRRSQKWGAYDRSTGTFSPSPSLRVNRLKVDAVPRRWSRTRGLERKLFSRNVSFRKGLSRCLEVFPIAIVFLAFEKETIFHFSKKDILQSARNVLPRVLLVGLKSSFFRAVQNCLKTKRKLSSNSHIDPCNFVSGNRAARKRCQKYRKRAVPQSQRFGDKRGKLR